MLPFVVDYRPIFDCSLTLYHATKHAVRATTRSRSTPSTTTVPSENIAPSSSSFCSSTAATANMYPTPSGSGNSFRNPYAFTSTRPTYSSVRSKPTKPASFGTTSSNTSTNSNTNTNTNTNSSSSSMSSATSTKSRLAAINSAYDNEYGCHEGCATAEEIRQARASQDRALKEFEAGAGGPALPESIFPAAPESTSSGSSLGSRSLRARSQSSLDDETVSSSRKIRRRFADRLFRRGRRGGSGSGGGSGSDDEDLLVSEKR